jgi:hypothetical protein
MGLLGTLATAAAPWPRLPRLGTRGVLAGLAGLGLLTGCPTVDLGDSPVDTGQCLPAKGQAYFQDQIWPMFLAPADQTRTCARANCHLDGSGRSALQLRTNPPVDFDFNYKVTIQYLNCQTPNASTLLTKPLKGVDAHAGGDIFPDMNDPAVVTFLAWFTP